MSNDNLFDPLYDEENNFNYDRMYVCHYCEDEYPLHNNDKCPSCDRKPKLKKKKKK